MLTKKQLELLTFLKNHLKKNDVPPSFDEMKDALNLKSKSGIHRLVSALEERGFIRRLPNRARAIEIIKTTAIEPSIKSVNETLPQRQFSPNVIPGNFPQAIRSEDNEDNQIIALPLYGKIAAGDPIEAINDLSQNIAVPKSLLGQGDHYALQVEGDSMVEAGIFDGDTAIIKKCENAENGTIVVALVKNEEVTLKKLRKRNNSIALEPANPQYETRIFGPDQVKLQGKLVGIIRKYS
ncbi:MAG: transcriptional repressor LexA [Pseudomonadota bacterium]|jgi:repressor LexA|nr:transcriptional repressor LexA [Pseudomonadota bacterium]|tara:strand:- start:2019 stop:2732 length:714 start_codon:yes stop_codon:yes gene_type:complete